MAAIIFGDSHGALMARQLGSIYQQWEDLIKDVVPILDPDHGINGYFVITYDQGKFFQAITLEGKHYLAIQEHFQSSLEKLNQEENTSFLLVGGNEHSQFIQTHSIPFDFFHPDLPDQWAAGRQIIDANIIRNILSKGTERARVKLTLIRNLMSNTRLQMVAPPPPIPSVEHLHLHSECFDFAMRPLEDKWVRLKVYKLYLDELRSICSELGLGFIEPPAECIDDAGFLLEQFWHEATHAEPAYYQPILDAFGDKQ